MMMLVALFQAASGPVQHAVTPTGKAYEVLLQYGAIGACLVIFVVLFVKILADNKRLGNLLIERDAAHDKDIVSVHSEYQARLESVTKMLMEEKDARRSELFKLANDYSAMVSMMRELGSSVKGLADRK